MAGKQESKYWMESEGERKRLASNHYIAKDAMGGELVRAPVDFSQSVKVLDSGTADGTWLLDLASSLPPPVSGSHEFVGTDLNPAPFPSSTPPNVTFVVQDIKKPWPESQHGQFDLVHQRLALLGAGSNPSASIAHLNALVKPGGWIQISEGTMDFPPDVVSDERMPAYCDMLRLMRAVAGVVGAEWHLGWTLRGLLEAAGFTDISEEDVMLNIGQTNKDEGLAREGAETCSIAVQGLSKFAQNFGPEKQPLSAERYKTLAADLEKELAEKGAVYPLKVVWGRKPA
ncbi:S-adenosyl-L-methionine-dependent methyltransferase [Chaetomium tenue]|uniref:S-adenosyl-L-methionine-dependent methyltransferase n=1 Tax=Chaetomium tenue TaxID=1854479 RepID=A0ACB7PLP6_9PEZI|nr:S-adenosyl-L-methionine-dependent methyltransferase [Chaetomium globosum]